MTDAELSEALIADEARWQRAREAADSVNAISDFARARNVSVVAMYPVDFADVVRKADIKVEHGNAPTPRSLRYQFFVIYTADGCVDVISDPDAPSGQLHEVPFAGRLTRRE